MSIKSVMPSSHLILCRPLLLRPPIPPSITVFSNESTLHMRWPKYCSFSFSIISSKEIAGLISFRMDWLDLLAAQGTLKKYPIKRCLLEHFTRFPETIQSPFWLWISTCLNSNWYKWLHSLPLGSLLYVTKAQLNKLTAVTQAILLLIRKCLKFFF